MCVIKLVLRSKQLVDQSGQKGKISKNAALLQYEEIIENEVLPSGEAQEILISSAGQVFDLFFLANFQVAQLLMSGSHSNSDWPIFFETGPEGPE